MSLFAKQPLRCQICGAEFMGQPGHRFDCACSRECFSEFTRREVACICGKPYRREDDERVQAAARTLSAAREEATPEAERREQ